MYIDLKIFIIEEKCMSIIFITEPHKSGLRTGNIQTLINRIKVNTFMSFTEIFNSTILNIFIVINMLYLIIIFMYQLF